jgi:hypothetical protein
VNSIKLRWRLAETLDIAGNNEDYALAESIPLELDYSVEYPDVDFRKTSFPARYIYEVLLPNAITKHAPDMYYHRGSPYSGSGKRSDDKKHGDIHQWNVWHVRPRLSPEFFGEKADFCFFRDLKSLGTIGIFWPAALSLNSECQSALL